MRSLLWPAHHRRLFGATTVMEPFRKGIAEMFDTAEEMGIRFLRRPQSLPDVRRQGGPRFSTPVATRFFWAEWIFGDSRLSPVGREAAEAAAVALGARRRVAVALRGAQAKPRGRLGESDRAGDAVEDWRAYRLGEFAREPRHARAAEHDRLGAVLA